MIRVGMILPTWGKVCGIAEYIKQLIRHTADEKIQIQVFRDLQADLPAILMEENIDVVHIQHDYGLYDLEALSRIMHRLQRGPMPVITTQHSWCDGLREHHALIASHSRLVLVHSEAIMQRAIRHGYPQSQLRTVPMGCDQYAAADTRAVQKAYGISGRPLIGFFGFPFPHKGIEPLVEAVEQLRVDYPLIRIVLLAHFPDSVDAAHPFFAYYQSLQARFAGLDYVHWRNEFLSQETVVGLLAGMDVNILPYEARDYQGVSSAVRSMMAAEKPIITTDNLFFSDLDGEVYKIQHVESGVIASAIRKVLSDEGLRRSITGAAKAYVDHNQWSRLGQSYRKLYRELAERSTDT